MKEVVINQFAGLGDVLFIEPIYRHYHNLGYKVIAPVNPDILWIAEYIDYVQFENKLKYKYSYETVEQPEDGRLHIPMRFAHPLLRGYDLHYGDDRENWMPDKYTYLNLPIELWHTMKWKRHDREMELWKELNINEPYNLINQNFGGNFSQVPINPNNGLRNIYMTKMGNYTLLDWAQVIENAENIYTVETSAIYIIEVLKTKAKEFHMYPRYPWLPNCNYIKIIMTKNWAYHDESEL